MHLEIERRFLVNIDKLSLPIEKKYIKQGYIFSDTNQAFRVRKINHDYLITYKYKQSDIERLEFEYSIPADDGEKLFSLASHHLIEKDRYYIHIGDKTWEVDIFHRYNNGLIIAEIELENKSEKFEIPNWVGKEISLDEKYLNFNLSKNPYSQW